MKAKYVYSDKLADGKLSLGEFTEYKCGTLSTLEFDGFSDYDTVILKPDEYEIREEDLFQENRTYAEEEYDINFMKWWHETWNENFKQYTIDKGSEGIIESWGFLAKARYNFVENCREQGKAKRKAIKEWDEDNNYHKIWAIYMKLRDEFNKNKLDLLPKFDEYLKSK